MGVNNKIESQFADLAPVNEAVDDSVYEATEDFSPFSDDEPDYRAVETSSKTPIWNRVAGSILLLAGVAWIALFVLSRVAIPDLPLNQAQLAFWVNEANAFAVPMALIAIVMLFVRRGSAAEMRRFKQTTAELVQTEAQLAQTLDFAAQNIAHNRMALTDIGAQLSELGEKTSHRMDVSGAQLRVAFDAAGAAAEKMHSVTDAAVGNLDRLRSQVPVLTNSAKDLTNAIAHAGGGAALQIRDLGHLMAKVTEQNEAAASAMRSIRTEGQQQIAALANQLAALDTDFRTQLQDRRAEAEAMLGAIGSNMDESGARLIAHLAEADVRVSALMQNAQDSARNLAKLVTGNAQIATQHSQHLLAEVDGTMANLGARVEALLSQTHSKAKGQITALTDDISQLDAAVSQSLTQSAARQAHQIAEMAQAVEATHAAMLQCGDKLSALTEAQQAELVAHLHTLSDAIAQVGAMRKEETQELSAMATSLTEHIDATTGRIAKLSETGTQQSARLAFAFEASSNTYAKLTEMMGSSEEKIDALLSLNDRLRESIAVTTETINETLPSTLNRVGERIGEVRDAITEQSGMTRNLENQGERLVTQFRKLDRLIAEQSAAMERLNTVGVEGMQARIADSRLLADLLTSIRQNLVELDGDQAEELSKLTQALMDKSKQDIAELSRHLAGLNLTPIVQHSLNAIDVDAMASQQVDALSHALEQKLQRIESEQDIVLERLESRLLRLSEMANTLEAQVHQTEGQFGSLDEDGFARRMALLTESLNSAAIDVAKILSNEVTDTAWQNYLKGDRGVFTRRAVRLLNQQESRVIARQYDDDSEFRTQVNRYIHDFESMMRVLLSTRDGHVISVTLLSSDVGKLYVALAQAIERLRQ